MVVWPQADPNTVNVVTNNVKDRTLQLSGQQESSTVRAAENYVLLFIFTGFFYTGRLFFLKPPD